MSKRKPKPNEEVRRQNRARAAGELVGAIGGVAFKRFGFVQGAVVSRWPEIVGERYAKASAPESIRFPAGKKEGGALTLVVEGAHAPLMQHLAPTIIERVNRFFGYQAVARIQFRQGRLPRPEPRSKPQAAPAPRELGPGLREIADPELKAVLESLAGRIAAADGPPTVERPTPIPSLVNLPKVR
ncbi:DciA family protein [Sphingomonas sp. BN140010]|uniref:DciA family protein n=1 Tax=Sphingomonas arvum TaxID=2992113 RepID=A0ABT3JBC5_9SPHN|nr:DciA family protein [Sphingomonas sp. BN140010]MCW3796371.1 DciA family protein [Sphingomonas sp. BN140010]